MYFGVRMDMRRLVIDEIVKQTIVLKKAGDLVGYKRNIELLRNIVCSIAATIQPSQPSNPNKLDEIKFIVDEIKRLQALH